jgi:UDP-N-acetyl-D-glucosamine dehydrogenase
MTQAISTSPSGEEFLLPTPEDETAEFHRLENLVEEHRKQNHEIVVVMGVGFVGAVMAGIVADSVRKVPEMGTDLKSVPIPPDLKSVPTSGKPGIGGHDAASCHPIPPISGEPGEPGKFVIGMQRPSTRSFWKIPLLNRGVAPVEAEDPEVAPLIARCVLEWTSSATISKRPWATAARAMRKLPPWRRASKSWEKRYSPTA